MQCSQCGNKIALFKINGKVKADKEHDMCFRCFRSISAKIKNENKFTINLDWANRGKALELVLENHILVLATPNTENENISCHIKLTPGYAGARFYIGDDEQPRLAPDLKFNYVANPMTWIKHWFHKLLDEPFVKQQVGKIFISMSNEVENGNDCN